MNRSNPVVRPGRLRHLGLTGARLLAVVAMLLGTLSVSLQSASAGAQGSGDSFTYDENGLEWSVSWDGSVWSESSTDSADFGLQGDGGSVIQFLTLTDLNEDPAGCLAGVVPNFEDGAGATSADPYEDDNGDPVLDDTDDYAYELRTVSIDIEGTALDADVVHACYALDSSSLLWVVGLVPEDADELDATFELFDGIEIAGDPVELGLADAVGGTSGTGDETPEASDDATEEASDDSEPSDDPTEEASDDSGSTGSGADEDAGTYESPTFGYSLEWNADDWTVEDDLDVDSYPLERDYLHLEDLDGTRILYVEGSDEWTDTDDCVATLSDEIDNFDAADAEVVEDSNGEPFEISDDDRSLAAYINAGDDGDTVLLFECRSDPESDVIVAFSFLSGLGGDFVEDVYPDIEEIIDSLSFSGGGSGAGTPEASDDSEPSDDPTEEASDDSEPSDDATPEASNDSSGGTGVDGDAYTSPTYGYELSWDEDTWTVEDESSEDDVDALTLSSDILTLNVTGYNSGDGDPDTCLDNYLTVINDRGDGDAEILVGDDGDAIGAADDSPTSAQRFIASSIDSEQFVSEVFCVSLDDESVLGIEFFALPDDLLSDDASNQINDILDAVSF